MAIHIYGIRYACDLCGVIANVQAEMPADPPPIFAQAAVPEGWANLSLLSLALKDVYGAPITHLCPVCAGLSVGQVAARLLAQYEEKANGRQ